MKQTPALTTFGLCTLLARYPRIFPHTFSLSLKQVHSKRTNFMEKTV